MEIYVQHQGESTFSALTENDGIRSQVDLYLIAVRPDSAGYLYVTQIDSHGEAVPLFPKFSADFSSGENPVKPGQLIQIPASERQSALFLDDQTGTEQVYIAFSASRWSRLERLLSELGSGQSAGSKLLAIAMNNGPIVLRGVGGLKSIATSHEINVKLKGGQEFQLPFPNDSHWSVGDFLVLGRSFRHVP